jgi:plasmid stabilization system protein ParE
MNDLARDLEKAQSNVDSILDDLAEAGNEETAKIADEAKKKTRRISDEIAVVIPMEKDEK